MGQLCDTRPVNKTPTLPLRSCSSSASLRKCSARRWNSFFSSAAIVFFQMAMELLLSMAVLFSGLKTSKFLHTCSPFALWCHAPRKMPRPGAGARTLPFFFLAVVAGDCSDGSCGVWPECKFGSWFDSSKAACSTCPVGASCKGLTADPICQSGWWRNQTEQPRKNQSFFFVECLVPSACRGFPKDLSCGCRTGHEGTLCARCVRNDHGGDRYMKRFNGECSRCIETDASYVWLWVVLAFFGAYVMAMTMTLNSGTSDRYDLLCTSMAACSSFRPFYANTPALH